MDKPKIMIVSTFHMAGHRDVYGIEMDNIASDERQREIRDVLDSLKPFGATKIAVEKEKKNQDVLNEDYRNYLKRQFALTNNESHQIGFRLAQELGHDRIFAVDWMEVGVRTQGTGDIMEYAKQNQPELFDYIMSSVPNMGSGRSIVDIFRDGNSLEDIEKTTKLHINLARVGVDKDYLGMGWLIWWYQRNLIIFANLAELISSADERILLLIGGSHTGILHGFIKDSGLFDIEYAADYL